MPSLICLMGPTASGKTALALELANRFPVEIVSVDSVMVYRGLDIGSAKPPLSIRQSIPHHLIDIADPSEAYSAGQFCRDAVAVIADITARGKMPLLVGGTMLYFRALQQGLAELPSADPKIRAELENEAALLGWPALHARLATLDPDVANKIHPHDAQRIQRALEVYLLTSVTMTAWQQQTTSLLPDYQMINLAIAPTDRALLHDRIAKRFDELLALGLVDEVRGLYVRGDLSPTLPALRAVGYAEVWAYLAGQLTEAAMRDQAIAATRQLAKRQLTWLRRWPGTVWLDSESADLADKAVALLEPTVN